MKWPLYCKYKESVITIFIITHIIMNEIVFGTFTVPFIVADQSQTSPLAPVIMFIKSKILHVCSNINPASYLQASFDSPVLSQ